MKNVYFIGIGGIGMSAIARYYNHAGFCVSGYDKTPSKLTAKLEEEGIAIHYKDDISYIPDNIEETLVIYTPAIPADMGELVYVRENGYRLVKRSRALGEIASMQCCLAIAGTHGKTTTSTMLAHIYTHSGLGCNAFLGGISKNYHTNLLLSKNPVIVAEADEFDRSFLQLFPDIAAITSTDADHLDIYGNIETIQGAFAEFASQIKESGYLIAKRGICLDTSKVKAKVFSYSFKEKADFYPE
ncbi:MAG: UDP-N-acetylmuramate--L-alanine ligase, partial [Bacteroidales bacterium]|nr:UDP-N-acetylmuramate--L-alanine ligase [Bacteroidales bacterium]